MTKPCCFAPSRPSLYLMVTIFAWVRFHRLLVLYESVCGASKLPSACDLARCCHPAESVPLSLPYSCLQGTRRIKKYTNTATCHPSCVPSLMSLATCETLVHVSGPEVDNDRHQLAPVAGGTGHVCGINLPELVDNFACSAPQDRLRQRPSDTPFIVPARPCRRWMSQCSQGDALLPLNGIDNYRHHMCTAYHRCC